MNTTNENLINTRLEDIRLLHSMQQAEDTPELKLAWEYQINLNTRIINALQNNDLEIADTLMLEIIRSTIAVKKYKLAARRLASG